MTNADELRKRTFEFAAECVRFCRKLPPDWDVREIGRQLLRAGTGVAANYRAACRGRSRREFAAKLGVVVEEADESAMWLELIERTHLCDVTLVKPLCKEANELLAIFAKSYRTARDNLRFVE